jgi:HlyD family secretion protein
VSKRIIWGLSALVLTSAVALGAWWTIGKAAGEDKVHTAAASLSAIHQEVYTTGTVNPIVKQEIRVLSPNTVKKVYVKVGETVKNGQNLLEMDTALADAQVAQAQAGLTTAQTSLSVAEANLEAAQKAYNVRSAAVSARAYMQNPTEIPTLEIPVNGQISVPEESVDADAELSQANVAVKQAEASVSQAQAMIKQAQEGVKLTEAQRDQNFITSNLNGTVLELTAQEGNMASVQLPLLVIADLSSLRLEAQLNEVDAGKVQLGQKVKITSRVLGEETIMGTVTEIAPQAASKLSVQGSTSPSVMVGITFDSVPKVLKPGFTANLRILTASKERTLAIPQEAYFQENGRNYVFKVVNQRLEKTEVGLGIVDEALQEIISGLQAGDEVVLNPTAQLSHGMHVEVDKGSEFP